MTRAPLTWLTLQWPRETTADQVMAAWRRLPAVAGWPLIVEAVGHGGIVHHRLAVSQGRAQGVLRQLRSEFPGLGTDGVADSPSVRLDRAGQVRFTTRRRPVATGDLGSASRAIVSALSMAGHDETLILQWVLGRPLHPQATPIVGEPLSGESWTAQAFDALVADNKPADREPRKALAAKQGEPGWQAVGRLAVRASGAGRQAQLVRQLAGALRSLESPGLRLIVRRQRPGPAAHAVVPWHWPLRLNALELASLSGWPVGETAELPVVALASRPMPVSRAIPRQGRIVAEGGTPGGARPLALNVPAALRHCHVLGPTGVGKSTLLLNLITQDVAAGHGVVVIEPKGTLIADVLARVPAERTGDVVLLDPLDGEQPVGLNPLAPMGRSPELVADQLLGTFHDLYHQHWGPRTQDILGAALLTLAQVPGMSLVAVPVLLTNAAFRRTVLAQIHDPVGLGPFWAGYEAWSEAERQVAIAPVLNKLRPFLLRPSLRSVLGQARPRCTLRQVFEGHKVLLVNLAKGQLGPEAAALLGALVVGQLWQAALGRGAIAPERRRPVFCYIDEFQDYLHLPVGLADALAQARGLGLALTLANQHLAQLTTDVRSAVLANAQSKVCFRLAPEDARVLAAGSRLVPEDFTSLGAYQCYLQLVAGDAVQPWASGRSLPAPAAFSDPAAVRAGSRSNYGRPRAEVEAAIAELIGVRGHDEARDDLAPRRRGGRR